MRPSRPAHPNEPVPHYSKTRCSVLDFEQFGRSADRWSCGGASVRARFGNCYARDVARRRGDHQSPADVRRGWRRQGAALVGFFIALMGPRLRAETTATPAELVELGRAIF